MNNLDHTVQSLSPTALDFVEVAVLERAGLVESRHRGIAALVGPDGKLVDYLGSAKRLIYPRSAVKPLQAVAMRRAGLTLTGAQLAICAGSHHGTAAHTDLVSKILMDVGLDESALQCPPAWPSNSAARSIAASETRTAFNCSGKHAGFLAASIASGWSTEDYLSPAHPMQKLVCEVLEEFSAEPVLHSTIDGCGAPLHTITVQGLAHAIGKFAANETEIAAAMLANPWAVGDENSPDAVIMKAGMVAKLGAEGVFVIGLRDGHGVAVKIADGSLRAAPLVALRLLNRNGLLADADYSALAEQLTVKSMGGNQVVGELRALS
jgi:L-asparaginase II